MAILVLVLYSIGLLFIFLYSLAQLQLMLSYLKSRKNSAEKLTLDQNNKNEWPEVTVQLPVYNEGLVVERLIRNIVKLDYPQHLLEIQVLDDSTDDSVFTTKNCVELYQNQGFDIQHITRKNREGFKAGALKEGLAIAKGEFIAVFDADFLPKKDWLQQTLPHFKNKKIGMVQTRWGHLNRDYSLITKIQALALDYHFIVEQNGRNFANHFINFNGTAGIWRKKCIEAVGNWQGDTLTEDLDLSYRAQLNKWNFKYLEDIETPAELPVVMSAARSQQFRWNKGAAENFQKNFKLIFKRDDIKWSTKFHAFFHLLNSTMFFWIFLLAILSVPMLFIKQNIPSLKPYFAIASFFGVSSFIFLLGYWFSYRKILGGGLRNFISFCWKFLAFFSVAMGLSVNNTWAILQGHLGIKTEFIRTPKFAIVSGKLNRKNSFKITEKLSIVQLAEFLLLPYFIFGIVAGFWLQDYGLLVFHAMLVFGFGYVVFSTLKSKIS